MYKQRIFDCLERGTYARVHGNGFIQIDLPGEGRLHLWGPPAIPCQRTPTFIHDHRFGFESTVLHGRIVNLTYEDNGQGTTPYDVYSPHTRDGEDTILVPTSAVARPVITKVEDVTVGQKYSMRPGVLHDAVPRGPTVTLMCKTTVTQLNAPIVLCEQGKAPDNDFVRHDFDMYDVVRTFMEALD